MGDNVQGHSFWLRQFTLEATEPQKVFDWIVGIVLPTSCLIVDPIVFCPDGILDLEKYRILVYLLIGVGMITLVLWLTIGKHIKRVDALMTCVLLLGSLCAFAIGVVLLPFSVWGLRILIGVLGFLPFFTGFVFLRNGVRIIRRVNMDSNRHSRKTKTSVCLIVPIIFFVALTFWVSQVRTYLSTTTYQERALQEIIQAAISGSDRFVVEDSTRFPDLPRTAISLSAWQILALHSQELPDAVTSITTTTDQADVVSSEIWIRMTTTNLQCHSADGDVLFTSFYVYTCTVVADPLP